MRILIVLLACLLGQHALASEPHDFFKPSRIGSVRINGRGDMLLYIERDQEYNNTLVVHDLAHTKKYGLWGSKATDRSGLGYYAWLKDDVVVVRQDYPAGRSEYSIYWPKRNAQGDIVDYLVRTMPNGYVVDGLRDVPNDVLYAKVSDEGNVDVFQVDYTNDTQTSQFFVKRRLNNARLGIDIWMTDHDGNLSFGIDYDGSTRKTWFSNRGMGWKQGFSFPADIEFTPYDIDAGRHRVLALSNLGGGRVKLGWWRLSDGTLDELVYEDPRVDLTNVLVSGRERRITGVQLYRAGKPQTIYLNQELSGVSHDLDKEFPEQVVSLVDNDDKERMLVLYVGSAKNPGEIYLFDVAARALKRLAALEPGLNPERMASVKVVKSRSSDGVEVESFLAMPYGNVTRPLLVMPHGGPLNARDSVIFNEEVQFLASRGYAVLQTNYRGSAGYGKQFVDQGRGQWGRGIEQDIRAAVAAALKEPGLDPQRVCVYGASYGGYSALMNAIQVPELFKCAASFAGVTDLPLLFNNSDVGNDDELRKDLVSMVGNPDADLATLKAYSPVYQYKKLKIPLFIAQGTDDPRVDLEHARRLTLLLEKAKIPHTYLEMPRTRHGFTTLGEVDEFYGALDKFLANYLKPVPVEGVVRAEPELATKSVKGADRS